MTETEKITVPNTGFASGGVTCKLGVLCFVSSSVLVDSVVLRIPPERKARKRYVKLLDGNLISSLGDNVKLLISASINILRGLKPYFK